MRIMISALLLGVALATPALSFEAVRGLDVRPLTTAEMAIIQGRNWWLTGYSWHTIANPVLSQTFTTPAGGSATVVIGSNGAGDTATISGPGFSFTVTVP